MRVHRMEIAICLEFSDDEKKIMRPSFTFGDAEEQLSYAIHNFGSERVTDLIIDSKNDDIANLAVREAEGLTEEDKKRLKNMISDMAG